MTSRKANVIFLFLFVIPYFSALGIIGVAYNSLVLHSDSLWRSVVAAAVGAVLLFFAKIPLERPLSILGKYTFRLSHLVVRFFILETPQPMKRVVNYLFDFILALGSTYLLRQLFPGQAGKSIIMGHMNGWLVAVLFLSLCIGAYLDFDALSITARENLDAKND